MSFISVISADCDDTIDFASATASDPYTTGDCRPHDEEWAVSFVWEESQALLVRAWCSLA